MDNMQDLKKLERETEKKLREHLELGEIPQKVETGAYRRFKEAGLPRQLGSYEKLCNFCENLVKVGVKKERYEELDKYIKVSHLEVTPYGVESFAFMAPALLMLLGIFASFLIFESLFFSLFFLFSGIALIFPLRGIPKFIANSWRMRASNQMVQCIFYVVTYMRHTSNLEGAMLFAAEHLEPPLSLDIRKILWDVETETYPTIQEALDVYLESWREWNKEFIESMHLIEASLFEPSDERRLQLLDKSLDVILTETYEKMLHYAHNLKSPITVLHMMGVILPILGLVILPLIVSFLEEVRWYHLATLYNIILPIGVYYFGRNILSKRPTGYGSQDIAQQEEFSGMQKIELSIGPYKKSLDPFWISVSIMIILVTIGLVPLLVGMWSSEEALLKEEVFFANLKFWGYRISGAESGPLVGKIVGPYGVGAAVLSLFFTLGVGFSIGFYLKKRSQRLMDVRNKSKELEKEFASALFQLGNRLGDGIPAELAFGKVAEVMQDTTSGKFFAEVSANISKFGYGVGDAIFHPRHGALRKFPSKVIESSMKVLSESLKKGTAIAARALQNVSRYIKEIHKVDERLKDLMADIISSMKSQIVFMTPAIAGIVVGITSMITSILGKLREQSDVIIAQQGAEAGGRLQLFANLFGDGIPTYYFQIIVGIYVVQIIYILSVISNGIENGDDKLSERFTIGSNLARTIFVYIIVAFLVTILFNFVAGRVIGRTGIV